MKPKRNPNSPWNPATPPDITPDEYERQVAEWLADSGSTLTDFRSEHLRHIAGPGGDYEFDVVAEFTALAGASFRVVVECKRYSRPVERDHLLALWAKKEDVNAQKAMMFATCGFQSGALDYARSKRIATITFVKGDFLYETRADGPTAVPPPWADLPDFAGIFLERHNGTTRCSTIDTETTEPLAKWLAE
jgi:restriction system protein